MRKIFMFSTISLFVLIFISTGCLKSGTGPSDGSTLWQKTFGDSIEGNSITQIDDGRYVFTGTKIEGGENQIFLALLNSCGKLRWSKTFEEGHTLSVIQSADGNFYAGGYSGNTGYVVKVSETGSKIWSRTYHDGDFRSLCESRDGHILACGKINTGVAENDVYLAKMDISGNVVWSKTYGGSKRDVGSYIDICTDGGYIILGTSFTYGTDNTNDLYLIRVDENGNQIWHNSFGGSGDDGGSCVRHITGGGFILSGFSYSFDANHGYVVLTDSLGNELWSDTYDMDYARTIRETEEGDFVLAGGKDYDIHLMKVDEDGVEEWKRIYGGEYFEDVKDMDITDDNGYVLIGSTCSFGVSGYNAYIVKTDENGLLNE